ncbi:MAG TPA: hypothetical protein VGC06_11115 [Actinomycetes bacterium]
MISEETLGDALGLGRVPDEELVSILRDVLPLSRWESGERVTYFHPERGHALDVVYDRHGQIVRYEPGLGLTDELVRTLRECAEAAFAADVGVEVRRGVLFSIPEIKGFWRHGDDWQILPAPQQAPRPGFLLGEHPFILEYRTRSSANFALAETRRWRRFWELHLLLSLLLRGQITRESLAHPHHWVLLHEPTSGGLHTAYVNEGYMVDGFIARADDFSDPAGHQKLTVVPDDKYYARDSIRSDDDLSVPACLDAVFDRFENADLRTRDQLLRASYWFDAAGRVWHTSKSLSYIAAINAIEALLPEQKTDPCPCCKRDRSPGPTARFRNFIETYAAAEGTEARSAMYGLRSAFVHGGGLHGLDVPRSLAGTLVPSDMKHWDLHSAALAVSATAIRTWFLNHDTDSS